MKKEPCPECKGLCRVWKTDPPVASKSRVVANGFADMYLTPCSKCQGRGYLIIKSKKKKKEKKEGKKT